jgi:hypothetical protein
MRCASTPYSAANLATDWPLLRLPTACLQVGRAGRPRLDHQQRIILFSHGDMTFGRESDPTSGTLMPIIEPGGRATFRIALGNLTSGNPLVLSAVLYTDGSAAGLSECVRNLRHARGHISAEGWEVVD